MTQLFVRSLDVLALRWLRAWGYGGRRPGLVALFLFGLLLAADLLGAAWLASEVHGLVNGQAMLRTALAAVMVVVLFFLAGPILLMTEAIRSRGSRLQGALSALPLSSRQIALLIWLPTLLVSFALLVLLAMLGAGAFVGVGSPLGMAIAQAATAILGGYSLTALTIAGARALIRRTAWSSVQYPIVLLAWMGLIAAELWQVRTTFADGSMAPWAYGLIAPWLVYDTARDSAPYTEAVVVTGVTILSLALLVWSTTTMAEVRYRAVAWNWSRRLHPSLVTLALTRLLRSRDIVANTIGAELIVLGAVVALQSSPSELRQQVFELLAAVVMLASSIPVLMVRGITKTRWPVPLALGYGPIRWTWVEAAAGASVALVVGLPGLAGFAALGIPLVQLATYAVPYGAAAIGLAMAIGWSAPASLENPIGQVINSFLLVLVFAIVTAAAAYELHPGSPWWVATLLWIGGGGAVWAAVIERERWLRVIGRVHGSW